MCFIPWKCRKIPGKISRNFPGENFPTFSEFSEISEFPEISRNFPEASYENDTSMYQLKTILAL